MTPTKPRVYRSGRYYRWWCPGCGHTTAGVRAHIVAVNDARAHQCPKGES